MKYPVHKILFENLPSKGGVGDFRGGDGDETGDLKTVREGGAGEGQYSKGGVGSLRGILRGGEEAIRGGEGERGFIECGTGVFGGVWNTSLVQSSQSSS